MRNMNTVTKLAEIAGDGMSKEPGRPEFEGEELEGVLVSRRDGQPRPTVILIPTVMGVSDLELGFGSSSSSLATTGLSRTFSGRSSEGQSAT